MGDSEAEALSFCAQVASNSALPNRETEWSYISEPGKQWQLWGSGKDFQRKYDWRKTWVRGLCPTLEFSALSYTMKPMRTMGFTVYLDYAIESSNILILKCKYLFLPIMSLTFQVSTNSLKYDVLYSYIPLSWSWDQRFMQVPLSSSTFSSMEEKLSHTSIFVEFMVFLLGMWNLLMTPLTLL